MQFAILITEHNGEAEKTHALIKTDNDRRFAALWALCLTHLDTVRPGMRAFASSDRALNALTPMHPDKDFIIEKLREAEFPLPGNEIVIDGEFTRL